jgi:hypothetical protein
VLAHGARVTGTWALGAAVYNDNPGAMSLLLHALEAGAGRRRVQRRRAAGAAASASLPIVAALLDAGASLMPAAKAAYRRCAWQSGPFCWSYRRFAGMIADPAVRWHMTLVPGSTLNGKYRVIDHAGYRSRISPCAERINSSVSCCTDRSV